MAEDSPHLLATTAAEVSAEATHDRVTIRLIITSSTTNAPA